MPLSGIWECQCLVSNDVFVILLSKHKCAVLRELLVSGPSVILLL